MNYRHIILLALILLAVLFTGCGGNMYCFAGQIKYEQGLAGLTFNDKEFERPDELDILSGLDNNWGSDRGNDWAAKWSGFIEGPADGKVTFSAEVNDGIRLTIGDDVVIDSISGDGIDSGTIIMKEGKRYPAVLEFVTDGGRAKLRLYWQWAGSDKSIVDTEALSYDPAVIDEIFKKLTPPSDVTAEMLANQYAGPREKLHIYLLIGQSNMAGRAQIPDEDTGPIEGCYMLDRENRWVPASNPLNRYSTIISSTKNQRLNPGYMFAKTMRKNDPNICIGLICNAKGATAIEKWMPGTRYYEQAVKRVKEARSTGIFKGVLWHQGEGNDSDYDYLIKLKKLIAQLRKDLGNENMYFVAGGIVNSEQYPRGKIINPQMVRLPSEVPFTGFASSDGLLTFDRAHFAAEDMKILGTRYAQAMIELETKAKKPRQNFK